jgi:hypothetical protein
MSVFGSIRWSRVIQPGWAARRPSNATTHTNLAHFFILLSFINKQDSQLGCSHARHTLFQFLCTERLEINASLEKINQHCNRICYIDITAPVAISDWQTNRRPPSLKRYPRKPIASMRAACPPR